MEAAQDGSYILTGVEQPFEQLICKALLDSNLRLC